jgi:hypothetical protein
VRRSNAPEACIIVRRICRARTDQQCATQLEADHVGDRFDDDVP